MASYNIFDKTRITINGLVNVIRMEGKVEGQTKIVYMFVDVHAPTEYMRECSNIYSQDFAKYIVNAFYKLNDSGKMYDFFFEGYGGQLRVIKSQTTAARSQTSRRERYIDDLFPIIEAAVAFNPQTGRVGESPIFRNIRLHFSDIRDAFRTSIIDKINSLSVPDCFRNFDITPQFLKGLRDLEETMREYVRVIDLIMTEPDSPLLTDTNIIAYHLRKLVYSYSHPSIQKIVVDRLKTYLDQFSVLNDHLNTVIELIEQLRTELHDYGLTYVRENQVEGTPLLERRLEIFSIVNNRYGEIFDLAQYVMTGITDCYLLRRLLDKDYITDAIIYAGGWHMINYLIALFEIGFRITHISQCPISSIDELNQTISDRLSRNEIITDLIIRYEYLQCVDITDFPQNFS